MKTQGHGPAREMPGMVKSALATRKLTDAFLARPEYQRTEYLTWINAAKLGDTKRARLTQMLDELEKGNLYMGEAWAPPAPVTPATAPAK
jgi:hypothetical protein